MLKQPCKISRLLPGSADPFLGAVHHHFAFAIMKQATGVHKSFRTAKPRCIGFLASSDSNGCWPALTPVVVTSGFVPGAPVVPWLRLEDKPYGAGLS